MPVSVGQFVNAPRFPTPGIVERDFAVRSAVVTVQGKVMPYMSLGAVLEYTANRGNPWTALSYALPDDPASWEVLCGDPQVFSAQDGAAVINALGQVAPPPAFSALIEGIRTKNGISIVAEASLKSKDKWERLRERAVFFSHLSDVNFLRQFDASATDAAELVQYHGPGLSALLKNDPYCLAGYPRARFSVLKNIANYAGYNNFQREKTAFILCKVAEWIFGDGHTFDFMSRLVREAEKKFNLTPAQAQREVSSALLWMHQNLEGYVFTRGNKHYVTYEHLFSAERYAAERAKALWAASPAGAGVSARARNAAARQFNLDPSQRAALDVALDHGLSVITGGPGTGKTHLIAALREACSKAGLDVWVGAATGRAARNLISRGIHAETVHRLLGIRPTYGRVESLYNYREKPAPCKVLIVDEAGMLDAYMFEKVLYAVADGTNVVLVGDVDQLPPVGPGSPFADTLASMRGTGKGFAVLNTNHRQGPGSQIPVLGAKINSGLLTLSGVQACPDAVIVPAQPNISTQQLGSILIQTAQQYGGTWARGSLCPPVLILAPGRIDVEYLNRTMQNAVNPGPLPFRPGDPVVQTVNNYEAQVMNGEMGRVVAARSNVFGNLDRVEVEFDQHRVVAYDGIRAEAQLSLAYVMTVHKAQGAEADVVVLPVMMGMASGKRPAWRRTLLYTAVTRARQKVVFVTDDPAEIVRAAQRAKIRRLTRYGKRVQGIFA